MVSKMKPLFKLWCLKRKGTFRYLFASKAVGISYMFLFLIYIMGLTSMLTNLSPAMDNNELLHLIILGYIGIVILLVFMLLINSRKALLDGEDAFYLFTAPFSKWQIMTYLSFKMIGEAFQFTLIMLMIIMYASIVIKITLSFLLLLLFITLITFFCFMILDNYLYVLSIGDKKYRKYAKIIPLLIVLFIAVILLAVYLQTGNYENLLFNFVQSELFYVIPMFGWIKLALIALIENNFIMVLVAISLMSLTTLLLYLGFINYRGDFYQQALEDGLAYSKVLKAIRKGDQKAIRQGKVKTKITGKFKPGALAILSKNLLIMRKGNDLVNKNDILTLGIYIGFTIFLQSDFSLFIYWVIIWAFSAIEQSELAQDMNNYQIYLIPEKPFYKLLAVVTPTFIKIFVYAFFAFLFVGLYNQESIAVILMYFATILGYTSIFISGTIWSLKIFRSRSRKFLETLMRIAIMFMSSLPSSIILFMVITRSDSATLMMISSYISLIMNLLTSLLILYHCRNIMNGWELKSE